MCHAVHDVVRADHVVSTLWSRSELTVCDRSILFTPDLHGRTHYHHGHKRGMADVLGSSPPCFFAVLRFLFIPFRQAP